MTPCAAKQNIVKPGAVSVIIPAYNVETCLSQAILSALEQVPPPLEVIVINDGSADGTAEVARGFGERIRYLEQPNSGPAAARNAGLSIATGRYLAFLDADDYWLPGFIKATVEFLEDNPEAVAVNAGYCKKDWNGNDYTGPELDHHDTNYYQFGEGAICPNFFQYWNKYRSVLTGTVLIRTSIAVKTQGQREELRLTQDLEFWGYLATFGAWGFIPQPLFVTDQKSIKPSERLAKFKRRFLFFRNLEVEQWAKRIRPRLNDHSSIEAFELFLGHIATAIILANAYTFQLKKSYTLTKKWEDRLDSGLGDALRLGAKGGYIFWPIVCIAIRFREYIKAYFKLSLKLPFGRRK